MTAEFDVDGFVIPIPRVAYRAMNFRQPLPGRTAFRYELRCPFGEFSARLDEKLEQCITALHDDYDKFGDDGDGVTIALAAAGWPAHDHVWGQPELMALIAREYLFFDILNLYAPATGDSYDFLVNTVDDVMRQGGHVVVTGQGYERGEGNGPWRR
ncbi:hypothetical protein ACPCHT_36270 [Nucisporomicrobium flavum]|uniref:hypothetical protein n=1 Tax=Nucisporomicrobium flavum TaxID=2785915 RepID=UPI003C300643